MSATAAMPIGSVAVTASGRLTGPRSIVSVTEPLWSRPGCQTSPSSAALMSPTRPWIVMSELTLFEPFSSVTFVVLPRVSSPSGTRRRTCSRSPSMSPTLIAVPPTCANSSGVSSASSVSVGSVSVGRSICGSTVTATTDEALPPAPSERV